MKALGILFTSMLAIAVVSWAVANKAPDRPPGIAATNWYPISERLGLVIPDYQPDLDPLVDSGPPGPNPVRAHELPPSPGSSGTGGTHPLRRLEIQSGWLKGYLMVKEGTQWERVAIAGSPSLLIHATNPP